MSWVHIRCIIDTATTLEDRVHTCYDAMQLFTCGSGVIPDIVHALYKPSPAEGRRPCPFLLDDTTRPALACFRKSAGSRPSPNDTTALPGNFLSNPFLGKAQMPKSPLLVLNDKQPRSMAIDPSSLDTPDFHYFALYCNADLAG